MTAQSIFTNLTGPDLTPPGAIPTRADVAKTIYYRRRKGTVAMLEELGHEPVEAASAAKALDILSSGQKIDLVVTDQAMPHMTGMQLVETIREKWPQLRVVIATGYAELPANSLASFIRLAKPFGQNDLARAITEAPTVGGCKI